MLRLKHHVKYFLSIHNYMKTYQAEMVTRVHGRFRVDQYQHLKDSQKIMKQIQNNQKNNYNKYKQNWTHLADKYHNIVSQRLDPRTQTHPEIYDQFQYYTKIKWYDEKQYHVIYRRRIGSIEQQLVLDIMTLPNLKRYAKTVELVRTCFNDSHSIIGFGCDLHNNQSLKFMFRQIKSGKTLFQRFQHQVKNIAFNDDSSIFFLVQDSKRRPYRLYFKKLGDSEAQLLYEQKDQAYYLDFHTSKDKKYLMLTCSTKVNTEILCIKKNTQHKFTIENLFDRKLKSRAFANRSNQQFYIWTDLNEAYDYKVCKYNPQTKGYQDFYVPEHGLVISQVDLFKDHMVLYLKNISKSSIRIIDLKSKDSWSVEVQQEVCNIAPGMNEGYNTSQFLFYMTTPFTYNVCYKYNMMSKKLTQLDKHQLTGPKFDQSKYKAHIVYAPSETNDLIPITIIESKKRKQPSKLLLHVYGFYGLQNQVSYNNIYLTALENGWVIAYAHVRGGKEMGKAWWTQAILQNKPRAWKDLKQCVAFLLKQRYTHPSLLVLYGTSAGAITVWNAVNQAPHLYKAAVMVYPFLDVLTSLLDESLALTISDHAQFGNPSKSKEHYYSIQSYCPYETIKTQEYPALYVQAGKNDYRCPLYQVFKFSQRFRNRAYRPTRIQQVGNKGLMVNIQQDASHEGQSDLKDSVKSTCQMFGYLDYVLTEANKDLTYA